MRSAPAWAGRAGGIVASRVLHQEALATGARCTPSIGWWCRSAGP